MLKLIFRLTVWGTRLYYPLLRIGGRLLGHEEQVEALIEVAEENIARSAEALGIQNGEE